MSSFVPLQMFLEQLLEAHSLNTEAQPDEGNEVDTSSDSTCMASRGVSIVEGEGSNNSTVTTPLEELVSDSDCLVPEQVSIFQHNGQNSIVVGGTPAYLSSVSCRNENCDQIVSGLSSHTNEDVSGEVFPPKDQLSLQQETQFTPSESIVLLPDSENAYFSSQSTSTVASLSLRPSMLESSLIDVECSGDVVSNTSFVGGIACSVQNDASSEFDDTVFAHSVPRHHDLQSFINVGQQMLLSSSALSADESRYWWSKYKTDDDWDELDRVAHYLFRSIVPRERNLAVAGISSPPVLPPHQPLSSPSAINTIVESGARPSLLPKEFICPLCQDIIVGAVVLDCGCATYCMECIERREKTLLFTLDESHSNTRYGSCKEIEDDFVLVTALEEEEARDEVLMQIPGQSSERKCPSCLEPYTRCAPCHALDSAISNAVMNVSSDSIRVLGKNGTNKSAYFARLKRWRNKVVKRHAQVVFEADRYRERWLGQLIQREEEVFWDCNNGKERNRRKGAYLFCREVGTCMLLAAAAVGANFLTRSK